MQLTFYESSFQDAQGLNTGLVCMEWLANKDLTGINTKRLLIVEIIIIWLDYRMTAVTMI